MQTIEQLLKSTIETAITAYTDNYYYIDEDHTRTVHIVNDLHFHDKNYTLADIIGLWKTGAGIRSNIPNFNAVQSPVQILFEVDVNFVQTFLACLQLYTSTTNGVVASVTDTMDTSGTADDVVYSYRIDWELPIASGSPYPTTVKSLKTGIDSESADVMLVVLRGSILYTSDQTLDDRKIYIQNKTSFPWVASTETYWNANGTIGSAYDIAGTSSEDLPDAPSAGIAARVLRVATYLYYVSDPQYDLLNGVTSYAEKTVPQYTSTQADSSLELSYNLESYSTIYSMSFTRDKADTVHTALTKLPHGTITSTTFDQTLKIVVTSLSVSHVVSGKITEINVLQNGNFETVNITFIGS